MRSLKTRIALNVAKFHALLAVVLFTSAGTLRFWQGWTFLGLALAAATATSLYLLKNDPALVERRLTLDDQGEKERVQNVVIALIRLLAFSIFLVAGLDRRFGWSAVPAVVVASACAAYAAGSLVIFLVFRENSYASSIIEVDAGQTVIATGPYRFVRHPMYAGALLIALATPVSLGSYWAEVLFAPLCALFVVRLLAEEQLLSERLPGYDEYMNKTRNRLIPGAW